MNIDESRTAKGFTPGSQVPNRTIEEIFIHHWGERGQTHDGVLNFFCTTGPGATSAHFVASAGRVNCIVSPADVAWHAGVWEHNIKSVGIECRPDATEDDYREVAQLVSWLREQYGKNLPLVPHKAVHATACPGVWDLTKLDRMARAIATPAVAPQAAPATTTKPTTTVKGQGKMLVISQQQGDTAVWIGDGITRRHIPDPKTLADIQKLAAWGVLNVYQGGKVMDYPLAALGTPVQ